MRIWEDIITTSEPWYRLFTEGYIRIWYHSHVRENADIGYNVMIGEHCYIDKDVIIGDNCRIQNGVSVYAGNILEEGVFIGPNATLLNDINPRAQFSKGGIYLKTTIKKGATIGGGAVILPGITIGEYAFVGAGAVVTRDVKAHDIMIGNPATRLGEICTCGKTRWHDGIGIMYLDKESCNACGYERRRNG